MEGRSKTMATKTKRAKWTDETVQRIEGVFARIFKKGADGRDDELFVKVANGDQKWAKYADVYDEVHVPSGEMPAFPAACPICGQPLVMLKRMYGSPAGLAIKRDPAPKGVLQDEAGINTYAPFAIYKCGGGYSQKTQIQNHTDKWWGSCPDATKWVEAQGCYFDRFLTKNMR